MSFSVDALGPLAYPLLACSFIAFMLIFERIIYFMMCNSDVKSPEFLIGIRSMIQSPTQFEDEYKQDQLPKAIQILLKHAHVSREIREEMANHYLVKKRNQLFKNFGWLTLFAVISPMLGLLGTVLGIINVFGTIASHNGPVSPALLADGLGQAMLTTAAGLIIALPVLVTLHGLGIWGNARLRRLAETLNEVNLMLEDVDLRATDLQVQRTTKYFNTDKIIEAGSI